MIKIHQIKKDCTIVKDSTINLGLDPILELREDTHCLLQFNNTFDINNTYILNLTVANTYNLNKNDNILAFPLLYDFIEGIGKVDYSPIITKDVNWYNRDNNNTWINEGGDYDEYGIMDNIYFDNTNKILFDLEYLKSFVDLGILLKWTENDLTEKNILLYSKDTHTIFYPKIIETEPQLFMSNKQIVLSDMFNVYEINPTSKRSNTVQRFRFSAKDLYSEKNYTETNDYVNQYNLPDTTYISLIDYATKDVIIPFNDNIKLNCDSISNYIDIDLYNLLNNRYYNIQLKVKMNKLEKVFSDFIFFIE